MKILSTIALFTMSSAAMALTAVCEKCGPVSVPEPGTLMLMGVGLLAGIGFLRKK